MKRQILSLIALVLVGIFVIGCTRGGVEEAAAVPPDGDDTIINDMENETVTAEDTTTTDTDVGDTTTETGTQDTTGTTY